MTNGIPDIWDQYQQTPSIGWQPTGDPTGQPGVAWSTSGNAEWMKNQSGGGQPQQQPVGTGNPIRDTGMLDLMERQRNQAPNLGGNMSYGGIRARSQGYFPNVNPGAGTQQFPLAPGVAEGQARMNQIANTSTYSSRRSGGSMVNSPQGGSMFVPTGQLQSYLDKGYTINTPPRTKAQQFDINQAYTQGQYGGVPIKSTQQGPGGPYSVSTTPYGGVANPISPPPGFIGRQLSALSGFGTFAANIGSSISKWMGNQNALANRGMSGQTSPQNYAFYNYNPSPQPMQPNRYFDY